MDSTLYDAVINKKNTDGDQVTPNIEHDIEVLGQNKDKVGDQVTPTKNTVLHLASQSGKTACVEQILLMHPSLLNLVNSKGEAAIHLAARGGHSNVVRRLINYARAVGGVEAAKEMLRMTNEDEDTPLHEAARHNHLDVVTTLTLEDLNYSYPPNKAGETPLYLAAHRGYHDLVSEILQNCQSPTYGGPDGRTALHGAINCNSEECAEKLVEWKRTLISETDSYGQTPLHYAARIGYASRACQLLGVDKSVGYLADKYYNNTALHIAASRGHTSVMDELTSLCPDSWDMVNSGGQNVLHIAVEHQKKTVVYSILENCPIISSLINHKDINGNTPLHLVATTNFFVPEIIGHRMADKEALNNQSSTPLDMAVVGSDVAEELKRVGATLSLWNAISDDETKINEKAQFKEMAQTHMIVAALIATVTFTAGFTLPGGINGNDGPTQGYAVLSRKTAFKAFLITDTMALLFSTVALVVYILVAGDNTKDKFVKSYVFAGWLTLLAIGAMMVAFITGTYVVLGHSSALAIATCVVGSCFFLIYYSILEKLVVYFRMAYV